MKKQIIFILTVVMLLAVMDLKSYASDWDKAGIALTAIEGMRVITGGKVDVIGSLTGINGRQHPRYERGFEPRHQRIARRDMNCIQKVWVPTYSWERKYVPEHEEFHDKQGHVVVEAHYIRYKVQDGGYWQTDYICH